MIDRKIYSGLLSITHLLSNKTNLLYDTIAAINSQAFSLLYIPNHPEINAALFI